MAERGPIKVKCAYIKVILILLARSSNLFYRLREIYLLQITFWQKGHQPLVSLYRRTSLSVLLSSRVGNVIVGAALGCPNETSSDKSEYPGEYDFGSFAKPATSSQAKGWSTPKAASTVILSEGNQICLSQSRLLSSE